jgi:hypothetical protein
MSRATAKLKESYYKQQLLVLSYLWVFLRVSNNPGTKGLPEFKSPREFNMATPLWSKNQVKSSWSRRGLYKVGVPLHFSASFASAVNLSSWILQWGLFQRQHPVYLQPLDSCVEITVTQTTSRCSLLYSSGRKGELLSWKWVSLSC